jgi:hypothetical protein
MDAPMSELDDLEDVATVTSYRGNVGSRPSQNIRPRWFVSPSIERAAAAREKPTPTPAPRPKTAEPSATPRMLAAARMISDYTEFVEAIRDRADELGMTRLELDHQAGIQSGYSGKLLSRNHIKGFGKLSLGPVLGALGLRLVLMEDTAQTQKIRARMTLRERAVRAQTHGEEPRLAKSAGPLPT